MVISILQLTSFTPLDWAVFHHYLNAGCVLDLVSRQKVGERSLACQEMHLNFPVVNPMYISACVRECIIVKGTKTKLRGLSPHANYTDRAAAAVSEVSANFCG